MQSRLRSRAIAQMGASEAWGAISQSSATTVAGFESSIRPDFSFQNFRSLSPGDFNADPHKLTYGYGPESYQWEASSGSGDGLCVNIIPGYDPALSTWSSPDSIVINFQGKHTDAFAGLFAVTDGGGRPMAGTITITIDDGSSSEPFPIDMAATNPTPVFAAFTSTSPIQSITITSVAWDENGDPTSIYYSYPQFGDFVAGAVPEPVFASALLPPAGLLLRRRKR